MIAFLLSKLSIFISNEKKKRIQIEKDPFSWDKTHISNACPNCLNKNDKMSDLICKTMKYLGSFINNQKRTIDKKIKNLY